MSQYKKGSLFSLLIHFYFINYKKNVLFLKKYSHSKLEAIEIWIRRLIMKVSWTEMKNILKILNQEGDKRISFDTIREKSEKVYGHLLRHNSFIF